MQNFPFITFMCSVLLQQSASLTVTLMITKTPIFHARQKETKEMRQALLKLHTQIIRPSLFENYTFWSKGNVRKGLLSFKQ